MNSCQQPVLATLSEASRSHRINRFLTLTLIAAMIFVMGVSGAMAANQRPLINAPLSPANKTPGSAAFTLTVNGTGFVSGATVLWNGNARTTTFVSEKQVTAAINATDVATAGTETVTVSNPAPGGGSSNQVYFTVLKGGYTVAYGKLDYATDVTPQDVAAASFRNNGIIDLVVATANNTVSVLLGSGSGTYPTHVEYSVPGHPANILIGDFNGDGKMDIATVDPYQSEISVLLGNGDGTFQPHVEAPTGNHPVGFAAADVNGDGILDLVVADYNDNEVAILIGFGDGTFHLPVNYGTGSGPSGVTIGDFNGDGKLDLAVANNGDTTVAILLGNGDGTFQGPIPFPTAVGANSVTTGDFNGDGKLDLAVGTSNKQVSILLGNGDGTFQNHLEYSIGADSVELLTADLNDDGKLDLISANYNDNTVSVLAGAGDGTFKPESIYPTNQGPAGLAIADFNNNGKLDIAAATANGNVVSVLTDSVISLNPTIISYGTQTSGFASTAKVITLKNNGTTAYTTVVPQFVGAYPTDFTYTTTCGATVAAGKTCTYSIVFTPTASEQANAQMQFIASGGSMIAIQMLGTGNIPIYLTPRNMIFTGYQLIGTKSAGKVDTFTNKSGVNIYFTLIDLEGKNPLDYSFTSTCAGGGPPFNYSVPLLPGASCTSTIYYNPVASDGTGGETIAQVYYGNLTLMKQGLLIQGNATQVSVSPTALNFGTQKAGTTSPAKVVTFTNVGSTALQISSASFSGNNDFADSINTCGSSVPANSSCTYSITFTPGTVGNFGATFSIGDPDPTGPQKITLSGTGD